MVSSVFHGITVIDDGDPQAGSSSTSTPNDPESMSFSRLIQRCVIDMNLVFSYNRHVQCSSNSGRVSSSSNVSDLAISQTQSPVEPVLDYSKQAFGKVFRSFQTKSMVPVISVVGIFGFA